MRARFVRLVCPLALALVLGAFQPLRAESERVRLFVLESDARPGAQAMDPALEIARRRLERVAEGPVRIRRQGAGRVAVEIAEPDSRMLVRNAFGIRPAIAIRLVAPEPAGRGKTALLRDSETVPVDRNLPLAALEPELALMPAIALDENNIERAIASLDAASAEHVVNLRLDERGTEVFSRMARDHVGERFAIVLDGKVVSAPFVPGPMIGRVVQIRGGFSRQEAAQLAAALTGARLSMPFTIVEERVIERRPEK